MTTLKSHERRSGAASVSLFTAAILIGAGATALALTWFSKTKGPERILERCDSALHELQHRLDELQAA
jgi:hypothetical protein